MQYSPSSTLWVMFSLVNGVDRLSAACAGAVALDVCTLGKVRAADLGCLSSVDVGLDMVGLKSHGAGDVARIGLGNRESALVVR